jgi:hypothetical protein
VPWRHTANMPSTEHVLHAPYDPEARYSQTRATTGFGDKAPIPAPGDGARPHLLTPRETPPATTPDAQVPATMPRAREQKNLLPADHLLARGYVATQVLSDSEHNPGIAVMGPIKVDTTWQAQAGKGFDLTGWTIAWDHQRVPCPGGHLSQVGADSRDNAGHPRSYVRFAKARCQACPVRTDGTRAVKGPRPLRCKPRRQPERWQWARQREQTEACKER